MPKTPTDQLRYSKRGDGFPGRTAWNRTENQFRATLARLARDSDPEAAPTAGRIIERATKMLDALTAEAAQAEEKADQERARLARRHRAVVHQVNRLGRAGRPLPPNLAALVVPPETRRDGR